jgi:TRAP-type C4-dicarboxylate transport system substrate-binding protein
MRLVIALALLCAQSASADTTNIRLATIAPDGAAWTRELKAFGRDVDLRSQGRLHVKWYWGAIAGDEMAVLERIRREQVDGEASGLVCNRLAPSLQVMRVLGLFQSRDEVNYVLGRLRGDIEGEFRKNGFFGLAGGLGSDIVFSKNPIRSLADLRKSHLWLWDLDEVMLAQLRALGLSPVALPVDQAARAYDDNRLDGFIAVPTAAVAYQWSAQAHWFTDLRFGSVGTCLVIANRVFDALPIQDREIVREAAAKLDVRLEDLGRKQDEELLAGLFAKQGARPLRADSTFRAEFFSAARDVRSKIPPSLVPPELLRKVEGWLADYRAEHAR